MRLRTLLGLMLALGLAGCGGSASSSPPAAGAAGQSAQLVMSLDLSRLAASSARRPDYIGAGVTAYNFILTQNGNVVSSGNGTFASCPAGGPCTASASVSPGTGLLATVNVTNGSVILGTGSSTNPVDIPAGGSTSISVQISPHFQSTTLNVAAPVTLIADGTPAQTNSVVVKALDPIGNVINAAGGAIPNWPTISFAGNDTSGNFALPANITTPSATAAGTTVNLVYNGGAVTLTPAHPTFDLHATGSGSSNTVAIPVVFMSANPNAPAVGAGPANVVFTEANSSTAAFTEGDTCAGMVTIGAPSYLASGVNMTATYSLTAISAFATCTMTVTGTDHAVSHQITISGPGAVQGTIQSTREHH